MWLTSKVFMSNQHMAAQSPSPTGALPQAPYATSHIVSVEKQQDYDRPTQKAIQIDRMCNWGWAIWTNQMTI